MLSTSASSQIVSLKLFALGQYQNYYISSSLQYIRSHRPSSVPQLDHTQPHVRCTPRSTRSRSHAPISAHAGVRRRQQQHTLRHPRGSRLRAPIVTPPNVRLQQRAGKSSRPMDSRELAPIATHANVRRQPRACISSRGFPDIVNEPILTPPSVRFVRRRNIFSDTCHI